MPYIRIYGPYVRRIPRQQPVAGHATPHHPPVQLDAGGQQALAERVRLILCAHNGVEVVVQALHALQAALHGLPAGGERGSGGREGGWGRSNTHGIHRPGLWESDTTGRNCVPCQKRGRHPQAVRKRTASRRPPRVAVGMGGGGGGGPPQPGGGGRASPWHTRPPPPPRPRGAPGRRAQQLPRAGCRACHWHTRPAPPTCRGWSPGRRAP